MNCLWDAPHLQLRARFSTVGALMGDWRVEGSLHDQPHRPWKLLDFSSTISEMYKETSYVHFLSQIMFSRKQEPRQILACRKSIGECLRINNQDQRISRSYNWFLELSDNKICALSFLLCYIFPSSLTPFHQAEHLNVVVMKSATRGLKSVLCRGRGTFQ